MILVGAVGFLGGKIKRVWIFKRNVGNNLALVEEYFLALLLYESADYVRL